MTVPPSDNDPKLGHAAAPRSTNDQTDQSARRTPDKLWDETLSTGIPKGDLAAELSPEDHSRAGKALGFLKDVRAAFNSGSNDLPDTIGKYTILRSIGRGGFAEVFLAQDEELDRRVALKVPLFNTGSNDAARQRFEREARLAASLGHPQIVPVYEFGEFGPMRFIAFGWCDGVNLAEWKEKNESVDFRTAAQVALHLADAVQHAHQRGIVHRDLKPTNVLVETGGDSDEPVWKQIRIADFGLARNFESVDTVLTQEGQILGTPAYMAPEQAKSENEVGPAADVWAIGMILLELLTDQLPFRRPDLLASIRAISDEQVPRARSLRKEVPRALDAIVDLCLRKTPSERYASAHELSEDLRRYLNDEPVKARPESAVSKTIRWARRNPALAASIAITIASLAIGLGVALQQRNTAIKHLKEIQTQTTRADGNLETAQKLINSIVDLEKQFGSNSEFSDARTSLVNLAANLQMELAQDETLDPEMRFDIAMSMRGLSNQLVILDDTDAAFKNAALVLELLDGLEHEFADEVKPSEMHGKIYETRLVQRMRMATMRLVRQEPDKALALYDANEKETIPEGFSRLKRATWLAESLRGRAMALQTNGDRTGSAEALHRAIGYFDEIDPPTEPKLSWNYYLTKCRLHMVLASDETALGKLDDAETNYSLASSYCEELTDLFPKHPMLANTKGMLVWFRGGLSEQRKEWDSAIVHYEECREIQLAIFESNPRITNPANIYILASLALCRSHAENNSQEKAGEIANSTLTASAKFQDQLKGNAAFDDNMKLIREFAAVEEK